MRSQPFVFLPIQQTSVSIEDFPDYKIENTRQIYLQSNNQVILESKGRVTLWKENRSYTRSVSLLYFKAFNQFENSSDYFEDEIWITVSQFPQIMISSKQRIVNLRTMHVCQHRQKSNGYMYVNIPRPSREDYQHTRTNGDITVHYLMALAFIPSPIFENETVHHIDNDTKNNDASNLMWLSPSEQCTFRNYHVQEMGRRKRKISDVRTDFEDEIWKSIPMELIDGETSDHGFEASNFGRVRHQGERDVSLLECLDGIIRISFQVNKKSITRRLNRIIAGTFLENSSNLPIVVHVDHDKQNHHVSNLRYSDGRKQMRELSGKQVYQYNMNGDLVAKYSSIGEAQEKTGFKRYGISKCCSNMIASYQNYVWTTACFILQR